MFPDPSGPGDLLSVYVGDQTTPVGLVKGASLRPVR